MKANLPRSLQSLSKSDRKKLAVIANEQLNRDIMIILDIYLKMSCEVLHDAFVFGEKRLYMYLGNYRQLFRRHCNLVQRGEQLPVLDARMRKIFRKHGYPDEFFNTMFADWQAKTGRKEDFDNGLDS